MNALCRFDTADSRQTDIEKDNIRVQFADRLYGIFPGTQLAHDVDSWIIQKDRSETAPRDFMVIDENKSKGIHLCIHRWTF